MSGEVVCPDCGKMIAPRGAVEESARCRCADGQPARKSASAVSARANISVPVPPPKQNIDEMVDDAVAAAANAPDKTCYVCGKSLAGRVRLKDNLGRYWCKQCASADKRSKRHEEKGRCADCSKVFKPEKMIFFQNVKLCATCHKAREKAIEKKIMKSTIKATQDSHEVGKLKWMAVIIVVIIAAAAMVHFLRR